jgi:hypothetical protein
MKFSKPALVDKLNEIIVNRSNAYKPGAPEIRSYNTETERELAAAEHQARHVSEMEQLKTIVAGLPALPAKTKAELAEYFRQEYKNFGFDSGTGYAQIYGHGVEANARYGRASAYLNCYNWTRDW